VLTAATNAGFALLTGFLFLLLLASCGDGKERDEPAPGVSLDLARLRSAGIADLSYRIHFDIPDALDAPVRGKVIISLQLPGGETDLILDFKQPAAHVLSVFANGSSADWRASNGHLIVPGAALHQGLNEIVIQFLAGNEPLNRHTDYLYTLFVPDRASAAFPCFDQPDLKGRYRLTLEVPESWTAVANAPALSVEALAAARCRFTFSETPPLSTYFFSFAAGVFEVEEGDWRDRKLRFYHRETDRSRVERNLSAIFQLHATALDWLEEYTGIALPFDKFDFIAIPAFQFSGMEHPGAVLYRDSRLFLDASATQAEILDRASLIAHETAHMWFGDLVTMRWFDDVWTKEVFANFMAAKIVNPSFPEIDHDLRFFLAHYPAAYEIDRTEGTHPIRQPLENMNEAASLYGAIIYQKAPIVMRQLEFLIGDDALRSGLRDYLRSFAFSNATWPDLVAILDRKTDADLQAWSRNWVEREGRPHIEIGVADKNALKVRQRDPLGRGLVWPQKITPLIGRAGAWRSFELLLTDSEAGLELNETLPDPAFILPDAAGVGYGLFRLDPASREHLIGHSQSLPSALSRACAWLHLYEAMLEGDVKPRLMSRAALDLLRVEKEELNVTFLLRSVTQIYWGFLSPAEREVLAPELENVLWDLLHRAPSPTLKSTLFKGFTSIALTRQAEERLHQVWADELRVPGLSLAEQDYMRLAWELAVRRVDEYEELLNRQQDRIENPDRRKEFAFVRPAVSSDSRREGFFLSLQDPENRKHEPWVLQALSYLHHPLHARGTVKYIRPGLDMLGEVQQTGDIFFPKGWLDSILSGHASPEAAAEVRGFLAEHPAYSPRLKGKILQSADLLFRKARIAEATARPR
jgi:aminopeptidase N